MEFSPEELEKMSSNWVQEKPKLDNVIPQPKKTIESYEEESYSDAHFRIIDEQQIKEREEELRKEREDKELEELIYQSIQKEKNKNSKPAIAETFNYEEKSKFEQEAGTILQTLLKEKNVLKTTASKLWNQLIKLDEANRSQPSQAKMAQVELAYEQLKELQEMSWRQALRK